MKERRVTQRHIHFMPPVIACRGARNRAPENTIAAFEAAREDGATWIEADVKLTSDGVAVLMHDDLLDRTTDGRGPVAETEWADIKQLDAGAWFAPGFKGVQVPTLAELLVFARATGMRLALDIKPSPGRAQATAMVALIEVAKAWPHSAPPPLISSFDIDALIVAAQLHPGWPRSLMLDEWRDDWHKIAAWAELSALSINADLLTPQRIARIRAFGLPVLSHTVNDRDRARDLFAQGVEAVFCDDPAALLLPRADERLFPQ